MRVLVFPLSTFVPGSSCFSSSGSCARQAAHLLLVQLTFSLWILAISLEFQVLFLHIGKIQMFPGYDVPVFSLLDPCNGMGSYSKLIGVI